MTSNPRSREAAFADLVTGLIDARVDVASERFDAEIESAEASGRLDPATARLLRWWQRESVRAVTEHARTTIPASLVVLERAAADARDAVHRADAAWTTARGVTARSGYPPVEPPPIPPGPASFTPTPTAAPPEPAVASDQPAAAPAESAAPAEPPTPPTPPPPPPPHLPPTLEPPGYPSDPPVAPRQQLPDHLSSVAPVSLPTEMPPPDEAPAVVDLTDPPTGDQDPGATPPEGRRRTLLAGLTVLPRND